MSSPKTHCCNVFWKLLNSRSLDFRTFPRIDDISGNLGPPPVTKSEKDGVPFPSLTRRDKPRRVDLYYSSWCIRAAESQKKEGQLTACEVILFHHEDMGIPWEIAKLGIKQGMWNAVKKIDPGLRTYQKERLSGGPLSHCALMAHSNTRVSIDYLKALEAATGDLPTENHDTDTNSSEKSGIAIPRAVIVGGAIALACTVDRGLLTKAVIFGVARRFARMGRKT